MASVSVLKFDSVEGAGELAALLGDLEQRKLIEVLDSAIVTWPAGAKKPKTQQMHNPTGKGTMHGAFFGFLLGVLFFVPILGLAVGAGIGALSGSMKDVGIDDKFIEEVRSKVTEGTSALFLMSQYAVMDQLAEEVKQHNLHFELIASNLTPEQEAQLKEAFGE